MGAIDPRYPPLPRPVTIENLTDEELAALTRAQIDRLGTPHEGPCDWRFWARDEQMAPTGDWATWLYLAGRGAGKTRAGAEWVLKKVREGVRIIHLVAPTEADYRDVMIHGPVSRLTAEWQGEYERWQKRDLSARRYVYVWADGVFLQARMEDHGECMLVLIGATPEGKKELDNRLPGRRAGKRAELARTAGRGEKPRAEDRAGNRRRRWRARLLEGARRKPFPPRGISGAGCTRPRTS